MVLDILSVKIGDKLKIISTIPTVDGALYKDSVVKVDAVGFPDKDLRVIDDLGRLWYVDFIDVIKI